MQLRINNLKFSTNIKSLSVLFAALLLANFSTAQEVIEDQVQEPEQDQAVVKAEEVDSLKAFQPQKIDGVAAVVGDYVVLDSDIDKAFLQLKAQGVNTSDIPRCQLFGKLLEDKLYAHHAIQDSIEVSDSEIRSYVDQQIQQFLQQTDGSMDALLKLYKMDDEKSMREEMFEINKAQKLAADMQKKIIEDIEVTPDEVRQFFNKIPKDELPTFGTELKVARIVIEPKVSEEEKQKVIEQLKSFKADIQDNGASFRSKAVLYSDDPGSRGSGGKLGALDRSKPRMIKEFRDVAFSLQEGEISDPFETDFGFHIVYLEKVRGQEYDVSHILIIPKVSEEAISEAKEKLEKIRQRIVDGEISFTDAAKEFSDEIETRSEGGLLINPVTQDYNFELTKMDPELYGLIQDLKDDEVSLVRTDQGRTGNIKFQILTVTDRTDEHEANYARDFLKIKELALNEKKLKAIEAWQDEKIMDTYIKVGESHRSCEFASNWLKQ